MYIDVPIYPEKEEANSMNKSDLINALVVKKGITKEQAIDVVNLVFNGFKETLKAGGRIEIRGFGSFSVREYKPYKGRNPGTGKVIEVKPKRLPFFKVGTELKKRVDS
jgi:integration host factor subunit beta